MLDQIRWVQFRDEFRGVFLIKSPDDFSSPLIFRPKNFHLMIFHGWLLEFGGQWWVLDGRSGLYGRFCHSAIRPPTHDQSIWHEIKNTPASCQRSRNKTNCPSLVHNVHTIEMNSLITKTCCSFMCKLTLILFISNNEWIVQPASAFIFSSRHFVLKEC